MTKKSDQKALYVEELTDEEITAIEQAVYPPGYEHLNSELNDPEEYTMINYGAINDRDGMFYHIYPSILQVKMCGYEKNEMCEIEFVEHPDGEYWAFQYTGEDTFSMIYPRRILFEMCFTYGVDVEVKAGNGRIVHLMVKNFKMLT